MNKNISKYIEHTILSPEKTLNDIEKACKEAIDNNFAAVVLRGCYVKYAKDYLKGTNVNICSAVGATTGMNISKVKVYEAIELINNGANELDVYLNTSYIKSGLWDEAYKDIKDVVDAVKAINKEIIVKVIVECGLLYESDKEKVFKLVQKTGADYIKTTSGFVPGVATVADVKMIKSIVPNMKIKAASHVYDYRTAIELIEAGADRIGTTSAMKIIEQEKNMGRGL